MLKLLLTVSAALFFFHPSETAAQTASQDSEDKRTYPRAYFDAFNPQTARDMIDRLPGFVLDTGEDLRGFGAGAGNVLIDGNRPSSKSGGVEEALVRIPANSVERIDVIRGAAGASETAGQSVVANIVLARKSGSGSWRAKIERPSDGRINLDGEVTIAERLGAFDVSTQINGGLDRRPLEGTRITRDSGDALTLFQLEDAPSSFWDAGISSEAQRAAAGGSLTLNGRFRYSDFSADTVRSGFFARLPDGNPDQLFTINFDRQRIEGEFGADWTRALGNDWSLKLLSLAAYDGRDQEQRTFTEEPVDVLTTNSTFVSLSDSLETILRVTAARGGDRNLKPEFGAEFAYNRLDSSLSLNVEDFSGISVIDLPAANVVVEEIRGDAFANLIWAATAKLTLETGVGVEFSEISVSGDTENAQNFFFAKPFATLIYDARRGLQFRLSARHSVGQLDFRDFAASASAADDRLTAGNPELGPDQTTRGSFTIDWRSDERGAVNVEVFHEWRRDVLEQLVLPSGGQGVANAGSGRVWGVSANASLPLSPLIPGGLIEAELEFLDSTFDDPITGATRSLSSIDSPSIFVEFRQDLTEKKIAWGFSYRAPLEGPFFFANEESFNRDGEHWSLFIETTRFAGIKTNLEFSGIGGQNFLRERRFFDPDRSGVFTGTQVISRDRGMFVRLTASSQF